MHLLGGDQREARGQVEAHLVAEDAARAGAGAVALLDARRRGSAGGGRGTAARRRPYRPSATFAGDHQPGVPADPQRPRPRRSTCTRPRRPRTVPWEATYDDGSRSPASHCADAGVEAAGHRVLADAHRRHEGAHLDVGVARAGRRRARPRRSPARRTRAQSGRSASTVVGVAPAARRPSRDRCRPSAQSTTCGVVDAAGPGRSAARSSSDTAPERSSGGAAKASRSPRPYPHQARPPHSCTTSPGAAGTPPASSQAWAQPRVGWPANGSSPPGVQIRSR